MSVVLLHSIGLDRRSWQFVDIAGAIAVDLPGHGGGPALHRGEGLPEMAGSLLHTLGREIHVVGISLGGAVAQYLALQDPERVRSLVIVGTAASYDATLMEARAAAAEELGMDSVVEETLARWFTPKALSGVTHEGVAYARATLRSHDPSSFAHCWRALGRHSTTELLGGIRVPVTVIGGEEDVATPLENSFEIAKRLPISRFVTIPGPHMLHLENPGALSDQIQVHLDWAHQAA